MTLSELAVEKYNNSKEKDIDTLVSVIEDFGYKYNMNEVDYDIFENEVYLLLNL